jgi:hypothetical protein
MVGWEFGTRRFHASVYLGFAGVAVGLYGNTVDKSIHPSQLLIPPAFSAEQPTRNEPATPKERQSQLETTRDTPSRLFSSRVFALT